MNLHIIILAAGQGTRMRSTTPKVLHHLAGKPMLVRIVETAQQLNPQAIHIIYGHGGDQIKDVLSDLKVHWVHQAEQLGTGHAVMQALPHIPLDAYVLILSADVPLIQPDTLKTLIAYSNITESNPSSLALLVAHLDNPHGLGRIIRDGQDKVYSIVEEKDASSQEKNVKEVYTGMCCAKVADLARWLPQLSSNNAQNEYYLTEIIALASADKTPIITHQLTNSLEASGVNDRWQLQQLERYWQEKKAMELLQSGIMIADAQRFDLRGELTCGQDVYIDINCTFSGQVILGDGCIIGPNCHLKDVTLGAHCEVYANSVLEECHIEDHCYIGPFARLRAGTQLASECKIGNFVETKKVQFGRGTKASHLSYLGDAHVGKNVNIGAGTITCNYDGINKHQTIIEDGAFIGSDTQLVAPVTIGAHATIGAGSTIRKNAPPNELTLTESKQKSIAAWKRPKTEEQK